MVSDKKNNEQLCLDRVIRAKKLLHGESKQIVSKISGSEFNRENPERPDFVKYFSPASKHERGTLIGIEHFRVDHFSLQKRDGKIASTGIAAEKETYRIYKRWHEEVTTSKIIPNGAISDIVNLIAKQVENKEKSSYNIFLKSFEYSLDKHLESVDVYRANLKKLSGEKYNIELALLIELHSEFRNLFFNNKKGTFRQKNNFIPIFGDMVRLMEEKVDHRKVNYIILCMSGTLPTENPTVIATRTGEIRKHLERQTITVYEYAGEDLIFSDFQAIQRNVTIESSYLINGDEASFRIEYIDKDKNEQAMLNAIFYSLKQAYEYRMQGKNFVATFGTQIFLEVLGDYIIGWERKCGEKIYSPVFMPFIYEDIDKKMMEFDRKFPIQEKEEDYE